MRRILLCAFAILAAGAVRAETATGSARVLDGDTIEIEDTKVRLFGIDAPEGAQRCMKPDGHSYSCGDEATNRVKAMTSGHPVECKGDQHDQYGRLLAVCTAAGKDISRTLVLEGLAWAFLKYSRAYVAEEAEARAAKRGVFAANNIPPWHFRAGQWGEAEKDTLRHGC